jgi:ferrous iron transport protein B
MSTVATVKRETGGWKWPSFQFLYMLALGYFGAFLAFRLF